MLDICQAGNISVGNQYVPEFELVAIQNQSDRTLVVDDGNDENLIQEYQPYQDQAPFGNDFE